MPLSFTTIEDEINAELAAKDSEIGTLTSDNATLTSANVALEATNDTLTSQLAAANAALALCQEGYPEVPADPTITSTQTISNDDQLSIWGVNWRAQNPNQSYSAILNNWSDATKSVDFEVRTGDLWEGTKRSELASTGNYNSKSGLVYMQYDASLDVGSPSWVGCGQFHHLGGTGNPPVILMKEGGVMKLKTKYVNDGSQITRYSFTYDPNVWKTYRIEFQTGSNGAIKFYIDGLKVLDITGSIGYPAETDPNVYAKVGLYSSTTNGTSKGSFRNFTVGYV